MSVEFEDHSDEVMTALEAAKGRVLEIIGLKIEGYAKRLCPVGTVESTGKGGYRGGTLRNSITHSVDQNVLSVGSNVEYAPYVELGTGPYFEAPPEWESFEAPKGSGIGRGYVRSRPFLKPAVEDHRAQYERIAKKELGEGSE